MSADHARPWPILTHYDQEHLARIALPLGGIGTGTVSLGGRGNLHDWEIVNRPAKGFTPLNCFFALYAKAGQQPAVTRALEGALQPPFEGSSGSTVPNHGLPRFRTCTFAAAYPYGQVDLSDPDVPLTVRLEAFNPFIPADAERSGIPVAILRFVLSNPTDQAVSASVCGNLQNFIGSDGSNGQPLGNVNQFRRGEGIQGLELSSTGVNPDAEQFGSMALVTTNTAEVSYRTAWAEFSWGNTLLDFWDDFSSDGVLDDRALGSEPAPIASLAVPVEVPAYGSAEVTFLLTWHFPNRQSWTPHGEGAWLSQGACENGPPTIGNYYTTRYRDAWDAAQQTANALPELESQTRSFLHAFCGSDLPAVVKEAALFNLSTLRTQTCFRTPDGRFWGWEGCHDHHGSCYGSCTHVWNYEQATAFLFGDLACAMREIEFLHATRDDGHMSFRVHLPLEFATRGGTAAADGQMGCIMKAYRDWQLSGDEALLRTLWPRVRAALAFCWIPGGWDADRDGVMEGCQHNTMDVEYYGPNPQMGFWYLGALRAAEEMARYLGDADFAATCQQLFDTGSRWIAQHLFNGDYYEHEIRPPHSLEAIAPGLRHPDMGARDLSNPDLQLGAGCLVDQLVGQYMAHICGLGYLASPEQMQQTLHSIRRYNFRESLYGHFNHMRSYALSDESALLMASYPHGRRPERPFPYVSEVMTGFEYTAAVHMLYEGQITEGLRCISAIRARYDGRRRSPFNEAECGHHYARAMASWAAVLALTGFHYSAVTGSMTFGAVEQPSNAFWSTGWAWGSCERIPNPQGMTVRLEVRYGTLPLRELAISGVGTASLEQMKSLQAGDSEVFQVLG